MRDIIISAMAMTSIALAIVGKNEDRRDLG